MSLESNYGGAVADSFKMNGSGYWESTANHHLVDMAGELHAGDMVLPGGSVGTENHI